MLKRFSSLLLLLCLFIPFCHAYDYTKDKWDRSSYNAFVRWYNDTHVGTGFKDPYAYTPLERIDEVLSYMVQMDDVIGKSIQKNKEDIKVLQDENKALKRQIKLLYVCSSVLLFSLLVFMVIRSVRNR